MLELTHPLLVLRCRNSDFYFQENVRDVAVMISDKNYEFDVALSFAGEDRDFVSQLANALRRRGVKVFYDRYEKHTLWGKNLYTHLSEVYQSKARYCVMFLSQYYAMKLWTNHEREAAQARAFLEHEEYILPVRLDDTQIPGIPTTIGYLSWPPESAKTIADAVLSKLGKVTPQQVKRPHRDNADYLVKHYVEMLDAYEQAIQLDPNDAYTYTLKGDALYDLKRYEEALAAYEQAITLEPDNPYLSIEKGHILSERERFEETLDAYERYLEHSPNDAFVQGCKGIVLYDLERYEEARDFCERSLQLDSQSDFVYALKADALSELERFEEALAAYEQAIQLDPSYASAYKGKDNALYELKRYKEALGAFNQAIRLNPKDADVYVHKENTLKHLLADEKNARKITKKILRHNSEDAK